MKQALGSTKTNNWINSQITKLKALTGCHIEKVIIWDMAFIEKNSGKHLFSHPDYPFIQAQVIYIYLTRIGVTKILVTDDGCIYSSLDNEPNLIETNEPNSIFRRYECTDFPLGQIDSVIIKQNKNLNISELNIIIGSKAILLKSGEIYENEDGSLSIKSDDESILIFFNPKDASKINFNG